MGSYTAEWYGFEVKSRRHLMDLYIEPSFAPAICLQFHEMPDGRYKVFYNYQPAGKEEVEAVKAYAYGAYHGGVIRDNDLHEEVELTIKRILDRGHTLDMEPSVAKTSDFENTKIDGQ